MPVEVVFRNAGDVANMTPAAQRQFEAAKAAAEQAGISKIVVTGAREGGHLSHIPRGGGPGTEWDFEGYNPDGTIWSRDQRAFVAQGAREAGADRFGLYGTGRMLHIGQSGPGRPAAVWGNRGLTSGDASRAFTNPAERSFLQAYTAKQPYTPSTPFRPARDPNAPQQFADFSGRSVLTQGYAPDQAQTPGQQAVSAMAAGGVPIPTAKPSSGASSLPRLQGGGAKSVAQIGADLNKPVQMGNVGRGPEQSQEGAGGKGWMVSAANAFLRNQASPFDAPRAAEQIGGAVGRGVSTAAKSVGDTIGKFAGSFNGQSAPTTRAYAPAEQSGPPQNKQELIQRLTTVGGGGTPAMFNDAFQPQAKGGTPGMFADAFTKPNAIQQALSEQELMRGGQPAAQPVQQQLPQVAGTGSGTGPGYVPPSQAAPLQQIGPREPRQVQPASMQRSQLPVLNALPTVPTPQPKPQMQPSIAQGITAGALIQGQLPQLPTTGGATGATMLSRGMKDSEGVAAVQSALNRLGFDSGPTDGDFGPVTDQAVRAFQASKGLEEDGIVGPKTLAAIDKISRLGKGGGDEDKTFRKSEEGSSSNKGGGFDLWGSLTDLFGTGPR